MLTLCTITQLIKGGIIMKNFKIYTLNGEVDANMEAKVSRILTSYYNNNSKDSKEKLINTRGSLLARKNTLCL